MFSGHYLVYPKAMELFDSSGILAKVKALYREDKLPLVGYVDAMDVKRSLEGMKEEKYFDTLQESERKQLLKQLNEAFAEIQRREEFVREYTWKIHRGDNIITKKIELEDLLVLGGFYSSFVFEPDKIWNFEKHGFSNLGDFIGSLGALVHEESHTNFGKKGLVWEARHPNGRVYQNEISGDTHGDLRVYQRDVTPDLTVDPFGNEVSFRQVLEEDARGAYAYHSTERSFLVAVLKYIHHLKLPSEMMEEGGKPLLELISTQGAHLGAFADAGHYGGIDGPRTYLLSFALPLGKIDENGLAKRATPVDSLTCVGSQGAYCGYGFYVGPENELIITSEPGGKSKTEKRIAAVYQPSEVDDLLKGIFYQTAQGLGRTSVQEMVDIITYMSTDQMKQDYEETQGWMKKEGIEDL